ncbi:hypothetical protein B566_EDAN014745 [Ephemera danica]|nr:hypothetical protein B566_EDAN014745 [Ephemera danica]
MDIDSNTDEEEDGTSKAETPMNQEKWELVGRIWADKKYFHEQDTLFKLENFILEHGTPLDDVTTRQEGSLIDRVNQKFYNNTKLSDPQTVYDLLKKHFHA